MVLVGQLQELLVAGRGGGHGQAGQGRPVAAARTAAVWVCLGVDADDDLDGVGQHGHRVVLLARRMRWSVPVRDNARQDCDGQARSDRVVRLLHQASSSDRASAGSRGWTSPAKDPMHSWEEYAAWHLALTDGATDETKARYAFVYGDFRRLHRIGLIACQYRAAEWGHKEVELAAHDLLQHLDKRSG
jgi:hypothetical protein